MRTRGKKYDAARKQVPDREHTIEEAVPLLQKVMEREDNAWLWSACGECEYCETGWETLCPNQKNGGYSVDGSFGQSLWNQGRHWALLDYLSDEVDQHDASVGTAKPIGYYWRVGPGLGGSCSGVELRQLGSFLGDGTVRFEDGAVVEAHAGAMDVDDVKLPDDAGYYLCGPLPFMQAVRPVEPELDARGRQGKAGPVRRPRHGDVRPGRVRGQSALPDVPRARQRAERALPQLQRRGPGAQPEEGADHRARGHALPLRLLEHVQEQVVDAQHQASREIARRRIHDRITGRVSHVDECGRLLEAEQQIRVHHAGIFVGQHREGCVLRGGVTGERRVVRQVRRGIEYDLERAHLATR